MKKLILVRHGESLWNKENRFTGWTDVPLTPIGEKEARRAGELLASFKFTFDIAFTSVLRRAIVTQFIIADEMNLLWIPLEKDWRLNERHYGALQGLNKQQTINEYGEEQVKLWRRSYTERPPRVNKSDPRFPGNDIVYKMIPSSLLPTGESLKDTVCRVVPYWEAVIAPAFARYSNIMIVAHGNSLRALVKYLDKVSDADIAGIEIPTGQPLIYELDDNLSPLSHYYLG